MPRTKKNATVPTSRKSDAINAEGASDQESPAEEEERVPVADAEAIVADPPDDSPLEANDGGDDADTLQDEGQVRALEEIADEPVASLASDGGEGDEAESSALVVAVADAEIITGAEGGKEKTPPLTAEERERFVTLDRQVEDSFLTAARALREISERRLYRESYPTFEDYVRDRFDFTKRLAYYYIDAAKVADNLFQSELKVHIMPTSETQLRPLKSLPSEQQRVVWEKSVEKANGKAPSGALVQQTKEELFPSEGNGKASPPTIEAGDVCVIQGTTNELLTDSRGYWAIVDEVTSDGSVTISLYDRARIDTVAPSDLAPLPFKAKEKRDRKKLLGRLHTIDEGLGDDDKVVKLLMRHFGTLKAPSLTPIEEDIVKLLERHSRKSSADEEMSEEITPES